MTKSTDTPGGPAAYPKLFLVCAVSQQQLGTIDAALAGYETPLATGLRDDDAAARYVGLLVERQRGDEASVFLNERLVTLSADHGVAGAREHRAR